MKIPYYLKKRIINYVISAIMILILIVTLFPIGWMIYTSLKENNDILVGKIPLSHSLTGCRKMELQDQFLWVMTSDGGINKFDRSSLKLLEHVSARTSSTDFNCDPENIWIASANRGLSRIGKSNLSKRFDYKLPLGYYDEAKVVGTSLSHNKQFVWFSMQYKGFEKVIEFNSKLLKVQRILDFASPYSPIQIQTLLYDGDLLWVGSDKVLLEYNLTKNKIQKLFPISEYLPLGIRNICKINGGIVFSGQSGAYVLSGNNPIKQITNRRIENIETRKEEILLGTNVGFMIYDLRTGKIREIENLFRPVSSHREIIKDGELVPAEVSAFSANGENIFVGSSFGRVSQYNLEKEKVVETTEAEKGHLVVSWVNYVDMWKNVDFGSYLKNSFLICGAAMFFAMIFATLAAYAVARFDFPGAKTFSMTILATQMVPGIMFLIPIYSMFVKFSEVTGIPFKGTYYGIIFIYSAFFIPFSIWILRGFFAAIPVELEEAARIDGCNPFQVFWYVVLPLAVPGIIATGIWVFLTAWDELVFAWVLTSGDTMTIPVGIRNFVGNYQNRFDLIMAASTVATLPVMILFFLLQKHIVKGLTAGAVKG